jgi:rhodanese-related sulfurtransferase
MPSPTIMMAKTGAELVQEAKQRITEITPRDAQALHGRGDVLFVDVREPNEYNLGRVPGAMPLPRGTIENRAETALPRDKPLVLYCGGGSRSALAADTLQQMGFTDVRSMSGGFRGWVESGGDVEG